jgi:hypothetical protein
VPETNGEKIMTITFESEHIEDMLLSATASGTSTTSASRCHTFQRSEANEATLEILPHCPFVNTLGHQAMPSSSPEIRHDSGLRGFSSRAVRIGDSNNLVAR